MKNKIPEQVLKEIFKKRLKRDYLTGKVYNKLKKMILSGKLKKGDHLVQERIALQFNVSRQTIRSAFQQLRKEKLIVWKHRKGAFVK
ncbi:MAG: GntR family transcriptional regulator [Thermodesulfobacteriota bacterium]